MDFLTGAWVLSLLILMVSAPMAVVRTYAYVSGERDHVRTMRIAMIVAVAIAGLAGLSCVALTIALLAGA